MVDKKELKELLIGIVNDKTLTIDSIQDDTNLIGENGLFFDSIDVLELVVHIEKRYGIKIKDNDIIQEKFKTFSTFYNFITENEKK